MDWVVSEEEKTAVSVNGDCLGMRDRPRRFFEKRIVFLDFHFQKENNN